MLTLVKEYVKALVLKAVDAVKAGVAAALKVLKG